MLLSSETAPLATYLLDSLRSQDDGVVIPNTDAIFDADPNAAEMSRPTLVVGNIDTTENGQLCAGRNEGWRNERLDGDTLSSFEVVASGIPWTVMNVKTNIMAQVVWEERAHGLVKSATITKQKNGYLHFQTDQTLVAAADPSTHFRQFRAIGRGTGLRSRDRGTDKTDARSVRHCIGPAGGPRICHSPAKFV